MILSIHYDDNYMRYEFKNMYEAIAFVERNLFLVKLEHMHRLYESSINLHMDYDVIKVINNITPGTGYCMKVGRVVIVRPVIGLFRIYELYFIE